MNVFFIERASDGTVGGSHTCLYNLVKSLDRKKYKVWVGFYQVNSYFEKLKNIGVNVILLNRNVLVDGNALIRKARNWYGLIYKPRNELSNIILQNNIDLVVLNNTVAGGDDVVQSCSKLNIPIIAYERGYTEFRRSDILLSNKVHASIAVSAAIKANLVKQKYSANTRVIYDGIPIDNAVICDAEFKNDELKKDIGIPNNGIVIGIVGNIREWKGQEYFVKAFMALGRKYSNLYGLVIGGYGTEDREYVDFIKSLSNGSDVGKRLIYLGFRDDVPELLNLMDVFIHASINPEPFGMVILEAMHSKVAVIATNFGGPVESLDNGNCGILVPPRDVNAIIDGVEKYLKDSIFRKEMIERAHKRVIETFDFRRTVNMVDDLFQEVGRKSNASKHGIG